ncbi:unnamed protein product [Clonostachys rosea]|uniref:Uncharacterized protein n=1 Tax=Bionectria ochroleuca TaxID=29856 RepID=A0ABY6US04_BIOOC|nr:unnamed protein product [Clonostachys rosea]
MGSEGLINTIAEDLSGVFASVLAMNSYVLNDKTNKGLLISDLAANKNSVVRKTDEVHDDIEGGETNYVGVELGDVCSKAFANLWGLKDSRRVTIMITEDDTYSIHAGINLNVIGTII